MNEIEIEIEIRKLASDNRLFASLIDTTAMEDLIEFLEIQKVKRNPVDPKVQARYDQMERQTEELERILEINNRRIWNMLEQLKGEK